MSNQQKLISATHALPGRPTSIQVTEPHFVNHSDLTAPPTSDCQEILIGMGCFWGAERLFWETEGVLSTSVGYSGGYTRNPTYDEVCTGNTAHAEVVRILFDPKVLPIEKLLAIFWENHDPTQGMQQGNDLGTQYRSVIYVYSEAQLESAITSKHQYQQLLGQESLNEITTEIAPAGHYYFAETYHQQYLAKNPQGYCGLGGLGICFPPYAEENRSS